MSIAYLARFITLMYSFEGMKEIGKVQGHLSGSVG